MEFPTARTTPSHFQHSPMPIMHPIFHLNPFTDPYAPPMEPPFHGPPTTCLTLHVRRGIPNCHNIPSNFIVAVVDSNRRQHKSVRYPLPLPHLQPINHLHHTPYFTYKTTQIHWHTRTVLFRTPRGVSLLIKNGHIGVIHIPSNKNPAGIFTKPLGPTIHKHSMKIIHNTTPSSTLYSTSIAT